MKRIKIFKAYFVLWLFVYFLAVSNLEIFLEFFLSTLTFNIAIVTLLAVGTFMIFKGSKDLTMVAGTFGVLMYKRNGVDKYIKDIERNFPSNIATKIKARAKEGNLLFTENEKEEILTWIDGMFTNQTKYNTFFVGTVLMIGLLGTFSGLLGSIGSMAAIVASLAGGDVDIGQIMAKFSEPLGSMAVGFGSSLFGVISAILLSVMGYLLNKAQETLLKGVENWLNQKTLESETEVAVLPSSNMSEHQKSFMDVFVQQVSSLSHQMADITKSNDSFKEVFIEQMALSQYRHQEQMSEIVKSHNSFKEAFLSSSNQLNSSQKQHQHALQTLHNSIDNYSDKLDDLVLKSVQDTNQTTAMIDSINTLSVQTNETTKQLSQKDSLLMDLVLKQNSRDKDRKVEFFQLLESMESMDQSIKKSLKSVKKEQKPTIKDYLKDHFDKEKV